MPMASPTDDIQMSFNFTKLPIELQLAIIHLTYEPQIVVLETNYQIKTVPRNTTPAPVALHVNRLWREEALKFYELLSYEDIPELFPNKRVKRLALEKLPRIYMNLATDSITLAPHPLHLDDAFCLGHHLSSGLPQLLTLVDVLSLIEESQRKQFSVGFQECKATLASDFGGSSQALQYHMGNVQHMTLTGLVHEIREMVFIASQGYESEDHVKELIQYYEVYKKGLELHFKTTEVGHIKQGVGFIATASDDRRLVSHKLGRVDNGVIRRLRAYGWFQG
jgi:hypothetical protein